MTALAISNRKRILEGMIPAPAPEHPSDEEALGFVFDDVERYQYDLNRTASRRAGALADALEFARSRPWIYTLPDDPDAVRTAERCAVLEAAARFQLSEATVRTLAWVAADARIRLPRLWSRAWEGFADIDQLEYAVKLLTRFGDDPAGSEAIDLFDAFLAELVMSASPGSFRAKARKAARKLAPGDPTAEHARAHAERRVIHEKGEDGMSWLHLHLATVDATAVFRRATATAKHAAKTTRDGRTRDQLRTDVLVGWMLGHGTAQAVKTKVFVTVPLDRLTPEARATVRTDITPRPGGVDLNTEPLLLGDGDAPVDPATATRMLLTAGAFTRVITDPVTGVVLDMDRRARTVTRAQYEWLLLSHGTCTRDGCTRPAADADIDHWIEYNGAGHGPTDIGNLHPFCPPEHPLKGTTRLRYRRRPDHTVALRSPTGYQTTPEIPFELLNVLEQQRRRPPAVPDQPPF